MVESSARDSIGSTAGRRRRRCAPVVTPRRTPRDQVANIDCKDRRLINGALLKKDRLYPGDDFIAWCPAVGEFEPDAAATRIGPRRVGRHRAHLAGTRKARRVRLMSERLTARRH